MTTQVTVALPDDVYQRVRRLSSVAGRTTSDVIADMISIVLQPFGGSLAAQPAYGTMSDSELLHIADLQLESVKDERLSLLLNRQQAGEITTGESAELSSLMQLYQESLLREMRHSAVGSSADRTTVRLFARPD